MFYRCSSLKKIDLSSFNSNKVNIMKGIFRECFSLENIDLSFSYGKILSLNDNKIKHDASTDNGSSGSPIIRRSKDNYIIGLHYIGVKNNKNK